MTYKVIVIMSTEELLSLYCEAKDNDIYGYCYHVHRGTLKLVL